MTKSPSPAQAYLRQLDALLREIAPRLSRQPRLECKRFFSGGAVYADGRIFMTLTMAGLALKLPEDARAMLLREGGKPLRYFAKGHIKKEYVVVPEAIANRPSALGKWIEQSVQYVTR
ncbi:MAG: TfoX/Sxy family protein [Proteobacteria bacterium]|nr:TfoX/Sxy family protein [Pseudomonadota bacterium]